MSDTILYTLEDGDILLVPASAQCVRYTVVAEDKGTTISAADLPPNGAGPKQRRTQRHPRTPKKYWERQKLVAEVGAMDAAKLLGVHPSSLHKMALRYHWDYPRRKRGTLNGVADGE